MTTYTDLLRTAHVATSILPVCNIINSDYFVTNRSTTNMNLVIDTTNVRVGNHWDFRTISTGNSTVSVIGPTGKKVRIITILIDGVLNVQTYNQISTVSNVPIDITGLQGEGISGRVFIVSTTPTATYDIDIRIFAQSTIVP